MAQTDTLQVADSDRFFVFSQIMQRSQDEKIRMLNGFLRKFSRYISKKLTR